MSSKVIIIGKNLCLKPSWDISYKNGDWEPEFKSKPPTGRGFSKTLITFKHKIRKSQIFSKQGYFWNHQMTIIMFTCSSLQCTCVSVVDHGRYEAENSPDLIWGHKGDMPPNILPIQFNSIHTN